MFICVYPCECIDKEKSYSALFLVRVGYGCYMYHITNNTAKKRFTEPPHFMQNHMKISNQVLATHHHLLP